MGSGPPKLLGRAISNFHRIISEKWHFFSTEKSPSKNHIPTSNPPQLHHKKPSRNHHFSQDPPVKTPLHQRDNKTQKTPSRKRVKLLE